MCQGPRPAATACESWKDAESLLQAGDMWHDLAAICLWRLLHNGVRQDLLPLLYHVDPKWAPHSWPLHCTGPHSLGRGAIGKLLVASGMAALHIGQA